LQDILAADGFPALKSEVIFSGFWTVTSTDPQSQQWIDATGSFDGTNTQASPFLPATLIEPLEVWERIYNGSSPTDFLEMDKFVNGLPAVPKGPWNKFWEWRNDKLYIPGSVNIMDIRIRYAAYLADIVDGVSTPWYQQSVPIARCLDSLSLFVAAEYLAAQEDQAMNDKATTYEASARAAAALIGGRDSAQARAARSGAVLGAMNDVRTPGAK
jgi:hypothetical protein